MFQRLYRLLMLTVLMVAIFFVVSSMTFSGRLAEGAFIAASFSPVDPHSPDSPIIDYGAKSWKYQWWLLDGWLALLYLIDFVAIAYLWRPSPNNRR